MSRQTYLLIPILLCTVISMAQQSPRPIFHARREAASDLEVSGTLKGVPRGESRYVSREFLESLPRVSVKVDSVEDFPAIADASVGGIYLNDLARKLGAAGDTLAIGSAIEAICTDGYVSSFPPRYTAAHRPIFILTIDGLSPKAWAAKNHGYDAGPYFIAYEHFVPSFRVLSHDDWAQEPTQVDKLLFTTEERLYAGIMPKASEAQVSQGFQIARQNCYRCHNAGAYGGTKAGLSWSELGAIAKDRPKYFEDWVQDPQAVRRNAKMPPNKNYDTATLAVLQRYFATFAPTSFPQKGAR